MIALGRPCLADPEIPNKVATGREQEIRPCISCNYGCCTKVHLDSGRMSCAVNAQCANERNTVLFPAVSQKRIVVVGGGPGGCEAARVAALRGHQVTLFEKSNRLGGAVIPASAPSFKGHDEKLIRYFEHELDRLKVDVRLSTAADVTAVADLQPDVVVTATGAQEWRPVIPGGERGLSVNEALNAVDQLGDQVLILGAGQTGVETAIWLLELGHKVTILEVTERFMPQSLYSDAEHAAALLEYRKGRLLLQTAAQEIRDHTVVAKTPGGTIELPADTVIFATGFRGDDSVYQAMRERFPLVYNLGDSVRARNIYFAVHEGFELARNL